MRRKKRRRGEGGRRRSGRGRRTGRRKRRRSREEEKKEEEGEEEKERRRKRRRKDKRRRRQRRRRKKKKGRGGRGGGRGGSRESLQLVCVEEANLPGCRPGMDSSIGHFPGSPASQGGVRLGLPYSSQGTVPVLQCVPFADVLTHSSFLYAEVTKSAHRTTQQPGSGEQCDDYVMR